MQANVIFAAFIRKNFAPWSQFNFEMKIWNQKFCSFSERIGENYFTPVLLMFKRFLPATDFKQKYLHWNIHIFWSSNLYRIFFYLFKPTNLRKKKKRNTYTRSKSIQKSWKNFRLYTWKFKNTHSKLVKKVFSFRKLCYLQYENMEGMFIFWLHMYKFSYFPDLDRVFLYVVTKII